LIGPQTALNMMLTGRTLDGRKAKSAGVVDLLVAPRIAEKSAVDLVTSDKPARQAKGLAGMLTRAPFKSLIASQARKQVRKKDPYGHYPATLTMLDIWQQHDGDPLADPQALTRLLQSDVTRNLIRVFHLQERLKAFGKKDNARPVKHVHVIGAGVMGGGIAAWCALQGIKTTLQDTDAQRIAGAFKNAASLYARKDRYTAQAARDRLIPDLEGHGVATADLVIEAISENSQAK
ncbi:MAG: 3-hydroxyacyl-CoA dehydrogenase NAD-binding domain-containing protein, partial [Advenella sp.]